MMRPLPDPLADDFLVYRLPLTRGYVALVDWKDRIRIRSRSWRVQFGSSGIAYAIGTEFNPETGKNDSLYLHRWLTNAPAGLHVDHINHDGLDNRRANLRVVPQGKNIANRRHGIVRNRFGYRGVCFMHGGFYATIVQDGYQYYSSKCATPEEAARAWDELAVRHYGKFIELNFPAERRAA